MMSMNNGGGAPAPRSQIFVLRMWPEEMGSGEIDWRGSVQHVNSGEVRYFRDWPALESFVHGLLRGTDRQASPADAMM